MGPLAREASREGGQVPLSIVRPATTPSVAVPEASVVEVALQAVVPDGTPLGRIRAATLHGLHRAGLLLRAPARLAVLTTLDGVSGRDLLLGVRLSATGDVAGAALDAAAGAFEAAFREAVAEPGPGGREAAREGP